MRSAEEIATEIERQKPGDVFGFRTSTLLQYLPFDLAKPFLKEGVTPKEWAGLPQPVSPERVLTDWAKYVGFAWMKTLDHRGISAGRSIDHMWSWAWILNDAEVCAWCDDQGMYANYGAPILAAICKKYGWPWTHEGRPLTPGETEMAERMAQGLPCQPDCQDGCGA